MYRCSSGVGQATCSEGGLDIASSSGLEGDRVTDLCGTARLGGHVSSESLATCRKSELRRQTIGSSTGPRSVIEETHVVLPTDLISYMALPRWDFMWKASSFFMSAASRVQVSQAYVKIGRTRVWKTRTLVGRHIHVPIAPDSS